MRKIWRKDRDKDKDKRKSYSGSLYHTTSNSIRECDYGNDTDEATLIGGGGGGGGGIGGTAESGGGGGGTAESGTGSGSNTDSTNVDSASVTTGSTGVVSDKNNTRKPSSSSSSSTAKSIGGLIKSEYDHKVIKNSWFNVIINTNSVPEISDATLRLFRAELKGSHLYLYKPNLNYKNFVIKQDNSKDDLSTLLAQSGIQSGIQGDIKPTVSDADETRTISCGPKSAPLTAGGGFPSNSSLHPTNSNPNENDILKPPSIFKQSNNSNSSIQQSPTQESLLPPSNNQDYQVSYFDTKIPHPALQYDFDNGTFLSVNSVSVELIIHFIFFQYDELHQDSVDKLISIFPLLPDCGKNLRLINSFLLALTGGKFSGDYNVDIIIIRILSILNNFHDNFRAFLVKSDVAPYILKLLETIGDLISQSKQLLEQTQSFKSNMLCNQQLLLTLISHHDDKLDDLSPFQDLNGSFFLNNINLVDLVSSITSIDLMFFNDWNSNIDKSLLLFSVINNTCGIDSFYKKNPLFFNNDTHMHYLSRLLINHLFLENNGCSSLNTSSSSLEFKARLLEKWIDLGCLLDKSGNMSSWLGISSVILCQPILRLTKIWSLVSSDYIKLLKNDWSPVLFELDRKFLINGSISDSSYNQQKDHNDDDLEHRDSFHIMAPRGMGKIYPKERVIPYFGDLTINNTTATNINDLDSIWTRINYSFTRWNDFISGLNNIKQIIKYNDDVLKRYDTMGFIFSNESLNQVLYLGVNNDEAKDLPASESYSSHDLMMVSPNKRLILQLRKLIDINCDSYNLEKLMELSLNFEPELPEAYLNSPANNSNNVYRSHHLNHSNISLHSNESSTSLPISTMDPNTSSTSLSNPSDGFSPSSKLPTFNNHYFKIDWSKYDDLIASSTNPMLTEDKSSKENTSTSKHNTVIDNDLTFRIDDFVADLEGSIFNTTLNALDDVDNDDDDDDDTGLGIDVDDILNSDKFNNFSMTQHEVLNSEANDKDKKKSQGNLRSNNFSVISSESSQLQIYKYIPKYASVDKLIDILLIDSKYLDESITIDLTEYRFVFLLSYSSFITTRELLDRLAHRFINSGNAVISIMKKLHMMKTNQNGDSDPNPDPDPQDSAFPSWSLDPTVDLYQLGEVDYSLLLKIQINILKVLVVLINNFYSNFAMDLMNKKILIKLLKLFSNEILQWYNSNKIDSTLEKQFESLVNYYKKLKKIFVKKTYRPIEVLKFDDFLTNVFKFNSSLHEVPINRNLPGHKNVNKIEKFLHKFNKLLAVFYKGIKTEDWFKVYKILEIEFEKNGLLDFNLQRNITNDDNLMISNIFTYFETLSDPTEKVLILKKLPLVFRKLFKLYSKFRSYALIQLTDLNITVEEKLDRMKTLLLMLKICQLKMADDQFVFEGSGIIPSCIETVIVNVIYSCESRLFGNLWVKAATSLNADDPPPNYDDLHQLIPKKLKRSDLIINEPLLPCFGWIIENLMDVNRSSNFHNGLINFNKRYLIFKLIKELTVEEIDQNEDISHNETREFEFLLKLDESLVNNQNVKEFTYLENTKVRLFKGVLKEQHRILIVDNRKRQQKEGKEIGVGHGHNNTTTSISSQSLHKKSSNSGLRRQSLSSRNNSSSSSTSTSSRFKISGLFNKSRPFSLGGTGGSGLNEKSVSSKDLPVLDTNYSADMKQKPAVVIPLKSKKIFPVYLLPLSFKIDSDSGSDDYFFQCLNDQDMNDWLMKLNYGNRHWFYSRSLNMKNSSHYTTFGIPLAVVCNIQSRTVPKFLMDIFREIENEGIKDVGIYRISTSISELTNLKTMIDRTGFIDFEDRGYDTHALTSCVKSYFRELPDALLTDKVIEKCYYLRQLILTEEIDQDNIVNKFQQVLKSLPRVNYDTFKTFMKHLNTVSQYSDDNKMTAANIATVIGPALTEASNHELLVNNFGFMNYILERIIVNYSSIFEEEEKEKEKKGEKKGEEKEKEEREEREEREKKGEEGEGGGDGEEEKKD